MQVMAVGDQEDPHPEKKPQMEILQDPGAADLLLDPHLHAPQQLHPWPHWNQLRGQKGCQPWHHQDYTLPFSNQGEPQASNGNPE